MGSGVGTLPLPLGLSNQVCRSYDADFVIGHWDAHPNLGISVNGDGYLELVQAGGDLSAWVSAWLKNDYVSTSLSEALVHAAVVTEDNDTEPNGYLGPAAHLGAGQATEDQDGVTFQTSCNRPTPERNRIIGLVDMVNEGFPPGDQRSTDDDPRAYLTPYLMGLHADGTAAVGYDFTDEAALSMTSVVEAGGVGIFRQNNGQTNWITRLYVAEARYLTVTDLPSGYKAKVRDSGSVVLQEATEAGGTASVDMLKVDPAEAYDLIITDAGDDTRSTTVPVDGLWGGDEYSCLAGAGAGTLAPLTGEATGTYSAPSYVGAGAGILPVLLCLAAGTIGYPPGAGAGTLAPLTVVGEGTYGYPAGAGAGTLAPLTVVATGTAYDHSGAGAGTLAPLTGETAGTYAGPAYSGAGAGTLPALTAVATGTYAGPVYSGAGVGTLAPLTGAGEGTYGYPAGAGAGTLSALQVLGAGTAYDYVGAGAGTLPSPFQGSATGWLGRPAGSTRREYQSEFDDGTVEDTSFDRRPDAISRSYLQALAPGPRSLSDAAEGLLVKGWYCRADNVAGKVYLCPAKDDIRLGWSTEVELFTYTGDDIDEISFAFDQNGAPVVVAERDGNIWIRYYDPGVPGYVFEDFGVGRTPRMLLDDPQNVTDSDLLIFYIRDGELRVREQGDLYVSEESPGDSLSANQYVEGALRDHQNRVHIIISTRDLLAGTYVLTRISSQLYPFYQPAESLDIRNKAIAGDIVAALIIYEMPEESLDVSHSAVAGEIEIISRPEDADAAFDLALSVDSVEVIIFVILIEPDAESLDIANSSIAGTIVTAAIEYAPDAESLDVGNSSIAGTIVTP